MPNAISPMDFTASIFKIVRDEGPSQALNWLEEYLSTGPLDANNYRILQARSQIADAEKQIERFSEQEKNSGNNTIRQVIARPFDPRVTMGLPSAFWPTSEDGLYQTRVLTNPVSIGFNTDHLSDFDKSRFAGANFGDAPTRTFDDQVYVASSAQVSYTGWSEATLVSGSNEYHPARSGRLARLTGRALLREPKREVELAYVLPFPYVANNYYHSLTEMAYGLRHIHLVPEHTPIIFDLDPYGLLPVLCRYLNIDPDRLIARSDVSDALIVKAILPGVGPYYWSSGLKSFFRAAAMVQPESDSSADKIYVSRSKSSRSLPSENVIEQAMRSAGLRIIHAEDYGFSEQMAIFREARLIVTSHGAGLANLAFVSDTARVVEIFLDELLNRDFQRRSQFVTRDYRALFYEGNDPAPLIEELRRFVNL
ncbi:glycosyltransferase family 61 protein [Brachybacterium muris]|uniref:glycosyltransferase family 61 protein n=1 Tax=Brachybacterium muris TaxID=219301 RepID=UPI00223AD460|nr:glycosyltransferase family 61 protein [Brachybacterium muris]MCT2260361.1 glycosyltransferase family 61 protein [Brachybacterium muris]